MPYSMKWYIKDELIHLQYWGVTTVDELRESMVKSSEWIENSPREIVHTIIDVGGIVEQVSLKDSMRIVREIGTHSRGGWSLTIGEKSKLIQMSSALGSSIFKVRYRSFATLEQALAHLKEFDQGISWDKVELNTAQLMEG